ncbi:MAG: HAD family hydrolase [Acidimicrobiia bacterium]|nr:HAD family hydrolase [Acidimicrobiia bacterium]
MADVAASAGTATTPLVGVFDLDGTLLDTDRALADAFVALGIRRQDVTWGHVLAEECARLSISVEDYLDAYDLELSLPYPGVEDLLGRLDRWAVCSNKHPRLGHAELARLGWEPEVALFADAFDGPKALGPVLDVLGLTSADVLFVGDTHHDRRCATDVGCAFALAGWNPRAATLEDPAAVATPAELLPRLR